MLRTCMSVSPAGTHCVKRAGHGAFVENANHFDGSREWIGGTPGKGSLARWADGSLSDGEVPCEAVAPDSSTCVLPAHSGPGNGWHHNGHRKWVGDVRTGTPRWKPPRKKNTMPALTPDEVHTMLRGGRI